MTDPHPLTARGVGPTLADTEYRVPVVYGQGRTVVLVPDATWSEIARRVLQERHALWEAMADDATDR